jgi:hypothetical protein
MHAYVTRAGVGLFVIKPRAALVNLHLPFQSRVVIVECSAKLHPYSRLHFKCSSLLFEAPIES